MDQKKLKEANEKFEKLKKKHKDESASKQESKKEGMKGKDLRKNLGCGG